jgi:drug/metabolite transporter (DMT)-like permease
VVERDRQRKEAASLFMVYPFKKKTLFRFLLVSLGEMMQSNPSPPPCDPPPPRSRPPSIWADALAVLALVMQATASILLFTWLGKWLDQRFQTSPTYLYICVGIGSTIGFLLLLRLAKQQIEREP